MILFQIALFLYGWYSFTDWPYLYSLSNSLAIFVLFVKSHLSTGRYESRGSFAPFMLVHLHIHRRRSAIAITSSSPLAVNLYSTRGGTHCNKIESLVINIEI